MSLEKKEACGIIGVHDKKNPVAGLILYGLLALQHRGQEAAGIAVVNEEKKINVKKVVGLAGEGFTNEDILQLKGRVGIGHVRYSTVGGSVLSDAAPFFLTGSRSGLALAHNGNLVNYLELRKILCDKGIQLISRCDGEIILHLLMMELQKTEDVFEALSNAVKPIEGAYSVVCVSGRGELLVFRDPFGFKPLCYGTMSDSVICASESVAIDMCGGQLKGDIEPGEALLISDSGIERKRFAASGRRAHCMFEYVYFSRPDSIIDERCVYDVRLALGRNLAKTYENKVDVVVPVPDTSRPAAEGISRETGIQVAEGLIKNRYVHRTFIMPEQAHRENAVKVKLNPLRSILQGQRVIVVDDSIVRGTTLKNIVNMIRRAGAKEIHVRITCPPIISPCFYGIDISTHAELIASHNSIDEIRKILGADTLGYQTISGLVDAIGLRRENLCLACLTGEYPTPRAQQIADKMREKASIPTKTRYIEAEACI